MSHIDPALSRYSFCGVSSEMAISRGRLDNPNVVKWDSSERISTPKLLVSFV